MDFAIFTFNLGFIPTRQLARLPRGMSAPSENKKKTIHYESAELDAFRRTRNSYLFTVYTSPPPFQTVHIVQYSQMIIKIATYFLDRFRHASRYPIREIIF